MKPAHWARVTHAIKVKYSLSWRDAKSVYDQLGQKEGRKPSLRMVAAQPANLRGKGKKTGKAEKPLKLPKGVYLAPPPPPPARPAIVPKRQGARNTFERILRERGLPVTAIARTGIGHELSQFWRQSDMLEKLGDQLKRGYNQIAKTGRMKPGTKVAVERILRKLVGDRSMIAWHAILKQLYGVSSR